MDSYLTVNVETESELIVKRSRFIATVAPVKDYSEALEFIAKVRAKYIDATHNCYAFISDNKGLEFRFNDDKEPSGTAGPPILEVLKKSGLFCTAVVVSRYFGGIKLGASGLTAAYASAAANVISTAQKVLMVYSNWLTIVSDYGAKGKIDAAVSRLSGEIITTEYGSGVITRIVIPENDSDNMINSIADITSGKAEITKTKSGYYPYNKRGGL